MAEGKGWLKQNWTTPVILLGIFLLALYLRAYFPWSMAAPDGLLSGGSDSFYYHRIIMYNVDTGRQLVFDCTLNYPICLTNPRPPLFSWTIAVLGVTFSPFTPDAVTIVELLSTAVWGALTIFPMYFLAKEGFGRRTALLSAFLLAVLPAHLQRSPATNGDHDAMILFFVVTGFFFFLRSLKTLHERRWVEDWALWRKEGRASLRQGLGSFFAENRTSLLYAVLSGWCVTTIALIWQGWAYAPIILLVYFVFQILVHRFRNQDPMGISILFAVAVGLPLLVSFPWYYANSQIKVWYDVPAYLYVAALILAFVFTVTRDYPWALVVPGVFVAGGATLAVLSVFYPGIVTAFVSGAGYFVRTKAFETIAEAQPPGLSQIILSFGIALYFMALFGLLWMARGIPRHPTPDYLFIVVWAIAAIFMAQSAARFIFNAAPAFAMSSAWVIVLFLEWLRFDEMRKTYRSLSGAPRASAIRRSIKARHVLGSLVVLFLLIAPVVWYGVDAAIPFEAKSQYDRQIYNAYPDFLKPAGYGDATQSGGSFFLGAFGYSLPLEKEYFPAAWNWFRQQDNATIPENRPAFLSWWDYGFEATDQGLHPTVADNFLNGYHLAGNFITAQSEEEAIALLNLRLLEANFLANGRRFSDPVRAGLDALGVPWQSLEDAFTTPDKYVPVVEGDPLTYGRYESVQANNAKYLYGRVVLMNRLTTEQMAELNHLLRDVTGASIRYFAVDTRLFPLDGQNTGIFYAPVKLSDHRILTLRDGRTIPIDFFEVFAQTQRGQVNLADIRSTDTVSGLQIRYKEMFYRSMFYRAYVGFSPADVGQTCNDCIPGLPSATNQQIQQIPPMQAWNLSHFKLVYRTAYYNPYPGTEIANHTDAWRAISLEEGQSLQGKINRGEATGVVDLSSLSAIRRGIVFVKYYDGAFVNGTVSLDGVPWPGVRVTAHDEQGVPHDSAISGADGRYSLVVPFGKVHVQATVGALDNRTMVGTTTVGEFEVDVSDAASMREDVDADGDGVVDWQIAHDLAVRSSTLDGFVYLDVDRNGRRDLTEPTLGGARVSIVRRDGTLTRTGATDPAGRLLVRGLYAGAYDLTMEWRGRRLTLANITIAQDHAPMDLAVLPTSLQGYLQDPAGHRVGPGDVVVTDTLNGTTFRATTGSDGFYAFPGMLPGAFNVSGTVGPTLVSLPGRAWIASGQAREWHNITAYPSASVTVRTDLAGAPQGHVTVEFEQRSAARLVRLVTTGATADATFALPAGTWNVHARHWSGTTLYAYVGSLTVRGGESAVLGASLAPGAAISGRLFNADNTTEAVGSADVYFRSPAGEYRVQSDLAGRYLAILPKGTWTVQISRLDFTFLGPRTVSADGTVDFPVPKGVRVEGRVFRAFPPNATVQIEDPVRDAAVAFVNGTQAYEVISESDGFFTVALPPTQQFRLRVEHSGYFPHEAGEQSTFAWQGVKVHLTARNITVSGTLLQGGLPATDPAIPVRFRAIGPGAIDATATLDGQGGYAVALAPGRYSGSVDQDLSGNGDVRLQLQSPLTLSVDVDASPIAKDLVLVTRVKVGGTVTLGGFPRSPVVLFEGPDVRTTNASGGSFSIFVAPGTYTVSANTTQGVDAFLAILPLDVTGPTTIALDLLSATNVTGSVLDDVTSAPVGGVPVVFTRQAGGRIVGTSDSFGQYHALVLSGPYAVSVDHAANATVDGVPRRVRYTFSATVSVPAARFHVFDVRLARALDNTTVSGLVRYRGTAPVSTQVGFTARTASAMNATASAGPSGSYSVALQPGAYDVYASAPFEGAAFLGSLTVVADAPATLDLALGDAFLVKGVTEINGETPVAANVTFTANAGTAALRSSPTTGAYELFLPGGKYTASASAPGSERGVAVTYRATRSVDVTQPDIVNFALEKVVRRSVAVTWDATSAMRIGAGETVNYTVRVENTGNVDDTYEVSATGPDFRFEFEPSSVSLPFGTGNATNVRVQIAANADARVDHSPITLTVRSTAGSAATDSVILTLDIVRFRGFTATVAATAPTWDGRYLNYTIDVHNAGNGPASFRLTLPNLDEIEAAGWRASFVGTTGAVESTTDIVVGANATQKVTLRFCIPSDPVSRPWCPRSGAGQSTGVAGVLARVQVVDRDAPAFATLATVNIQMPVLAVEGGIRASGPGVSNVAPGLDLATTAFLVSLAAAVGAVVYLSRLRRRSR